MSGAATWLNPGADGTWSDSASTVAEALRGALTGRTSAGAVLVGAADDLGAVIEPALTELSESCPLYYLHGSEFASDLPYGSLSILLARLEIEPSPSWHAITKGLGQFLSPAGAETAVVIISQPELLDTDSVTVLAQLAQQRRVTLLVQCDHQHDLPLDFAALIRTGSLIHIAVRPLTPLATHHFLTEELGGPVSHLAATVLWRYTGGHPGQLKQVAEACLESGKLRRTGDDWVLASGPLPDFGSSVKVGAMLRRMPAQRRALLEMLASCGPIRVSELLQAGYGAEVDSLQEHGVLQVRCTPGGRVAGLQPLWADRVLDALEPERRRELDRLMDDLDTGFHHRLRLAQKRLVIGDAGGAVELFDRVERTVDDHPGLPDSLTQARKHLVWAKARALTAVGELAAALEVTVSAPDADDPCLTVLAAATSASLGDLPTARHYLEVASAAHQPNRLGGLQSTGRNAETVRLAVETVRASVLASAGDLDGARLAAARVDTELSTYHRRGVLDDVMSTYDRAAVAVSLLETYLTCGDLEACRDLSTAILGSRHGNPQATLRAELVLAAVELLAGHFDRAERLATQLSAQCLASGDRRGLAVAQALRGFCTASLSRQDPASSSQVGSSGGLTDQVDPPAWGRLDWLGEVIRCLTVGPGESDEAALVRLTHLADVAHAEGLLVVELHALLGAALLGSADVAERLLQVARCTQCSVSAASAELAVAIVAQDATTYVNALGRLAEAGYTGLFYAGTDPVLTRLAPSDARRLAGAAAAHDEESSEPATDDAAPIPGWLEGLTPRQREIAQQVMKGMSNVVVARRYGISVRTVEGHLYQIYTKLQVNGRNELTQLAVQSSRRPLAR